MAKFNKNKPQITLAQMTYCQNIDMQVKITKKMLPSLDYNLEKEKRKTTLIFIKQQMSN